MAGEIVTIEITQSLKKRLDELKRFPRESYDEIISRLAFQAEDDGLSDDDIKEIEEALDDIKAGRFSTTPELKKKLGLD